jgi:hypothetical protein
VRGALPTTNRPATTRFGPPAQNPRCVYLYPNPSLSPNLNHPSTFLSRLLSPAAATSLPPPLWPLRILPPDPLPPPPLPPFLSLHPQMALPPFLPLARPCRLPCPPLLGPHLVARSSGGARRGGGGSDPTRLDLPASNLDILPPRAASTSSRRDVTRPRHLPDVAQPRPPPSVALIRWCGAARRGADPVVVTRWIYNSPDDEVRRRWSGLPLPLCFLMRRRASGGGVAGGGGGGGAAMLQVVTGGGGGRGGGVAWRRWWWCCMVAAMVGGERWWCGGSGGGGGQGGRPVSLLPGIYLFIMKCLLLELGGPLGTCPPRGVLPALGEDAFAGRFASKALCQEEYTLR